MEAPTAQQLASVSSLSITDRPGIGSRPASYADFVRQTAHRWIGRQCRAA
jgi:hypothetical protein